MYVDWIWGRSKQLVSLAWRLKKEQEQLTWLFQRQHNLPEELIIMHVQGVCSFVWYRGRCTLSHYTWSMKCQVKPKIVKGFCACNPLFWGKIRTQPVSHLQSLWWHLKTWSYWKSCIAFLYGNKHESNWNCFFFQHDMSNCEFLNDTSVNALTTSLIIYRHNLNN